MMDDSDSNWGSCSRHFHEQGQADQQGLFQLRVMGELGLEQPFAIMGFDPTQPSQLDIVSPCDTSP